MSNTAMMQQNFFHAMSLMGASQKMAPQSSIASLTSSRLPAESDLPEAQEQSFGIFSAKEKNYQLEATWNFILGTPERQKQEAPGESLDYRKDGKGAFSVPMGRNDCVENRRMKMGHERLGEMVDSMRPDPTRCDSTTISEEGGITTVREESKDGEWREIRYNKDRSYVSMKNANVEIFRDGDKVGFRDQKTGMFDITSMDDEGNLINERKEDDGTRKTRVAGADGSYREMDGQGKVSKSKDADPAMARYEATVDRIGRSIGPGGEEIPLTGEERYQLAMDLRNMDPRTLDNLEKSGLKIRVVDHENPPAGGYPGGMQRWKPESQGCYNNENKVLLLKKANLEKGGSKTHDHIIRHEIGHAVDDLLRPDNGMENLATAHDPYINHLYSQYQNRVESSKDNEISHNANRNPQEFFAEGVAMYIEGDKGKEELRKKDPALYSYVEGMLNDSKDASLPFRQQAGSFNPSGMRVPPWQSQRYSPTYGSVQPSYGASPSNGGTTVGSTWTNGQVIQYVIMMMMMKIQQMMSMMLMMQCGGGQFMRFA